MNARLYLVWLVLLGYTSYSQNRYDIVIDEIMADPAPTVGLPTNEWIELRNISPVAINLQGWRIGDASGLSGPMPNFTLLPDSLVIICSSTAVVAMSSFGSCIAVTSFPSLDNNGELLFLKSVNNTIIHAIDYNSSWYRNDLKKEGGWTLEMIDPGNPCSQEANWIASSDPHGGTPGKLNSANAMLVDEALPGLNYCYMSDSLTIVIVYDEPVDSLSGATAGNYFIDRGLTIISAVTLPPLFNQVQLKINSPLQINAVYTITVSNVTNCKGERMIMDKIKTGRPAGIVKEDMIINEILFNPRPAAFDYIELYNKSNKIVDASKLFIANRNSSNTISSITLISSRPFYIFPGDYLVITEDVDNLSRNYLVKDIHSVISSSLPSFPDDKGYVILLNQQGEIADEVDYSEDWHFKLLNNTEGIALERIDPAALSQQSLNWHSAASTAGYGTPGYKNSQYKNAAILNAAIEINPAIFSPDNDGVDDRVSIEYKMDEPGYIANITIFDGAGRPVKNLVYNEILSTSGYWNWDGLNDKKQKLPVGTYIIFTEVFNLKGKKKQFKNVLVLARKLN